MLWLYFVFHWHYHGTLRKVVRMAQDDIKQKLINDRIPFKVFKDGGIAVDYKFLTKEHIALIIELKKNPSS